MSTTLLFESDALKAHFLAGNPCPEFQLVSFEEVVRSILASGTPLSPTDRLSTLAEWLPEGSSTSQAAQTLRTLERLREANLRSPDDLTYALRQIQAENKYRSLRLLFERYLSSPLSWDRAEAVARGVELLRASQFQNPFDKKVVFLSKERTGLLFKEFSNAYGYAEGVSEVRSYSYWNWVCGKEARRRPRRGHGTAGALLPRIAERVRHKGVKTAVLFAGSAAERTLFKMALATAGLTALDLVSQTPTTPTFDLIQQLRSETRLPLTRRLEMTVHLLQAKRWRGWAAWGPEIWQPLVQEGKLRAEEGELLSALLTKVPANPLENSVSTADVILFGLEAIPSLPKMRAITYLGDLLRLAPADLLFSPDELDRLYSAGVPIAEGTESLESREQILGTLQSPQPARAWRFDAGEPQDAASLSFAPPKRDVKISHLELPVPAQSKEPLRLSASRLETYITCPAQYYFSAELRLRPARTADENFHLILGQATHETLERVARSTPQPLAAWAPDEIVSVFEDTLKKRFELLLPTSSLSVALVENFKNFAARIPEMERQLDTLFGKRKTLALEVAFSTEIEGISVTGKWDRIDQTEKGELIILDYKTGNVDFTPQHIVAGTHFQAPLYILAAEKLYRDPIAGILFYDLKTGELRRGLLRNDRVTKEAQSTFTRGHCVTAEAWQNTLHAAVDHLRTLHTAISAGQFEATPSVQACGYCDFGLFCRKPVGWV